MEDIKAHLSVSWITTVSDECQIEMISRFSSTHHFSIYHRKGKLHRWFIYSILHFSLFFFCKYSLLNFLHLKKISFLRLMANKNETFLPHRPTLIFLYGVCWDLKQNVIFFNALITDTPLIPFLKEKATYLPHESIMERSKKQSVVDKKRISFVHDFIPCSIRFSRFSMSLYDDRKLL